MKVRAALSARFLIASGYLVESGKQKLGKESTAVRKEYQIASREDSGKLREFLAEHGEMLLPMVELVEEGQLAEEEMVGKLGRAALEAVLLVSAESA